VTYAGATVTREQVRATVKLLNYYRRFLASNCLRCVNTEDRDFPERMDKEQTRRRVAFLINTAINRKAGIPDRIGRKQSTDYQASLYRDCRAVRDRINRRVIVRQFETAEIRQRYSHLLSGWDD
jgi:hypothetical protein